MRSKSSGATNRPTRLKRNASQNNRRNSPTQIHAIGMHAYQGQYSGETNSTPKEIHTQLLARSAASLTRKLLHAIRASSRPASTSAVNGPAHGSSGVCFRIQRSTPKIVAEPN